MVDYYITPLNPEVASGRPCVYKERSALTVRILFIVSTYIIQYVIPSM